MTAPNLDINQMIVDKGGFPTLPFHLWWQAFINDQNNVNTELQNQIDTISGLDGSITDALAIAEDSVVVNSGIVSASITGHDAGSNASVTISAHVRAYGDGSTVGVNSGTILGLSYNTAYYVYYDDPDKEGGSVPYTATTNKTTAIQTGGRHFVGTITTPAAAAADTTGVALDPPGMGYLPATGVGGGGGGGSGTVTSVALSVPTGFSVTGSPITTSGTLGITTTLNGYVKGNGSGFTASATIPASDTTGFATVATSGSAADLSAGTLLAARMPALTGDVTTTVGTVSTTISNDAVTNAKLANMATATFKGRVTAGTGDPEDLTGTQATTLLDTFTSTLKGVVPASGGGTTNFLRADGTWTTPGGGSDPWTWTKLAADNVVSTVAFANVTGMSFTASANTTYLVRVFGAYQTAATTTGIAITLDIPSGSIIGDNIVHTSATAVGGTEIIVDAASTGKSTGVRAASTNTPIQAFFVVAVGATGGTIQLMQASEVGASNTTLKQNLTILGYRTI